MPLPDSILVQVSDALSTLTSSARSYVAHVQSGDGQTLSGVLWKPNAIVVSEQALSEATEYEVTVGDHSSKAHIAGRDDGTNVAVLKLETELQGALPSAAVPKTGALALIVGASIEGVTARLAVVRSVGEAWESLAGGTIDHRILLDSHIGRAEEGGPVLAADGAILGISTRGAGRQSIVIPSSTVEKSVVTILDKGGVERGWLGVSLRAVALPESLRPQPSQRVGLMVMDVGNGSPAAQAGILAGDILLSAGGVPANRFGNITRQLGAASIGKSIQFTLARAGSIVTSEATVGARNPR